MKLRSIITAVIAASIIAGAFLLLHSTSKERTALRQTEAQLRREGFKVDLSEFDFSGPVNSSALAFSSVPFTRRTPGMARNRGFFIKAGRDCAVVLWKLPEPFPENPAQDSWTLGPHVDETAQLNTIAQEVLSGPLRFNLNAGAGSGLLLPHLAPIRNAEQAFAAHAILELHDGHRDTAWTNLLAATRIVTAWDTEPVQISQLVKVTLASDAYDAAWQVLQAGNWSDERLADLQREWEGVDFFKRLPETVAFTRASTAATMEYERQQPMSFGAGIPDMVRNPLGVAQNFSYYMRQLNYRKHGSYEDEKNLLLFYRNRELEMRRAIQSQTWSDMRQLSGATNDASFQFKSQSAGRLQAMMNLRRMSIAVQGGGTGSLSRVAEAEARRRVIITAIAVERFHGKHGAYPQSLSELTPEFLKTLLPDFMDGQPLRYRLSNDGHFVLYSVGLDCVDNGGELPDFQRRAPVFAPAAPLPPGAFPPSGPFASSVRSGMVESDLVWPRPATEEETHALQDKERRQRELQEAELEQQRAAAEDEAEAKRNGTVEQLLADADAAKSSGANSPGPMLNGKPLATLLRNQQTTGTNQPGINELLTPKQIITGNEPDTATFELPISYDTVTNLGRLHLVVDGGLDASSTGEEGELRGYERATNGDCLLSWTTVYDPPGKHSIQAEFIGTTNPAKEEDDTTLKITGPAVPYISTNICQYNLEYSHFEGRSAVLYAKLAESNGIYSIEIKSPSGEHVRTFKGSTTNGIIKLQWDLMDDKGRRYTNESFDSSFDITLPDSGRSQKIK